MITTILATIVALGVLVTVHEFGHFWVARKCGVRVLRFSVGFGKPLLSWKDKTGCEFCIAAIPLGGYVKMLDGRESELLTAEERATAFDHKPVGQRFAIVAAGPGINLLFAALLYAVIGMIGVQATMPMINALPAGTVGSVQLPAEVVSFDADATESWEQVSIALFDRVGEAPSVELRLRPLESSVVQSVRIPVPSNLGPDQSPLDAFGIKPWTPPLEAVLGHVVAGGEGERVGLQIGDRMLAVDGEPILNWWMFTERVKAAYERPIVLEIERAGERLEINVVPRRFESDEGPIGFIGVAPESQPLPPEMTRTIQSDPLSAMRDGVERMVQMSWLTIESIGKMFTGAVAVENLSGPLTIARVAGDTANSGWYAYLGFMAYLSVSLGILNLLPIPVLDGGHLVFFTLEWLRGKPVSDGVQMQGVRIGMALLLGLMVFAFYNDLMRL